MDGWMDAHFGPWALTLQMPNITSVCIPKLGHLVVIDIRSLLTNIFFKSHKPSGILTDKYFLQKSQILRDNNWQMLSSGFRRARKYPSPDMSDSPRLVRGSPQMTNSRTNVAQKMYLEKIKNLTICENLLCWGVFRYYTEWSFDM